MHSQKPFAVSIDQRHNDNFSSWNKVLVAIVFVLKVLALLENSKFLEKVKTIQKPITVALKLVGAKTGHNYISYQRLIERC